MNKLMQFSCPKTGKHSAFCSNLKKIIQVTNKTQNQKQIATENESSVVYIAGDISVTQDTLLNYNDLTHQLAPNAENNSRLTLKYTRRQLQNIL